ncbi:1,4-dihydroxy-2-naphthoate octaprenyltransferase [Aliiroseovarius crassostreae]|uniref:1,4-dihydroxy-2-naphthoate octaprenyltransferase n=1 Tax=Aliiroseovarius crassostreae TaxID=154981 RepID=UPI0021AEC8B3|nr:1,4-dihydroxy-2-naphthoate octaprenyltransferase [Aliiroseovarius crassostreae]UWQ04744.1 1,4-dihydroxy-2-naphthoate octaprenyltransferase [Aliiroseovarius crassostreae]
MSSVSPIADPVVARLQALPRPLLWVIAARVKTLSLSLVPVLAGSWMAAGSGAWRPDVALAAGGASAAIQIGTNLWNDAADAASGVDGPNRLGPPRLTSMGLLEAAQVRRAAAGAFGIAGLLGLYLVLLGGWPIVVIGVMSLALGFFYSMGPRPLSGTPLGELLVVAFFGVVAVAGTTYLHGQPVTGDVLFLGAVVGLPAAAILLINNHRDRETDYLAGRRTLAILIGPALSRATYVVLLALTVLGAFAFAPCAIALVPVVVLAGILSFLMMKTPVSSALNRLIPGTALFQLLVLLAVVAGRVFCG